MNKPVILLLGSHKPRAGKDCKDCLATFLVKRCGFKRYAFINRVKELVCDLYNFTKEQMSSDDQYVMDSRYTNNYDDKQLLLPAGHIVKSWQPNPIYKPFLTPQRILQIFWQEQVKLYPNIWTDFVSKSIQNDINSGYNKFVVTDFRFPNEFESMTNFMQGSALILPIKINRNLSNETTGNIDIGEDALSNFNQWCGVIRNHGKKHSLYRYRQTNKILAKHID